MAATGLRLARFYSAHPSCSPTRGSVITGRHPNRYGTFRPNFSIRPEEISIAQILGNAGYACGHFGYPVCPGTPYYVIGTPTFDEIELALSDGKTFKILAHNNSAENCYIKSAKLNGKSYDKTYISHFDIVNGGTLELEMTSKNDTGWGCGFDSVPFSASK